MAFLNKAIFLLVVLSILLVEADSLKQPHIVFIVADDLGWNDVGFRNPSMITPNIDKLAREGVILNQSYVQPVCTPSRSAFMSSVFPFKSGIQHYVLESGQPACSSLNYTFLPQELKKLGYSTHAAGKWHLGFCKWACTPTFRGFDTFFGFYGGGEDHFTHYTGGYLDYRDQFLPATEYKNVFSAMAHTEHAVRAIKNHNQSQPFFLYMPYQVVHAPVQVPKQYEDMYPNVLNEGRRKFCGMVSVLDEGVGNITQALKDAGMYDDTLIIFTADNGGELLGNFANNWPLRAGKHTVYEGGTRGTAFVHGSMLQKTQYTYNGMIHAVDWMPTIISAAGGTPITDRDGMDQWDSLQSGSPSKRSEFVYNLDDFPEPLEGHAAIRMGDMKLIEGYPGRYDGWYLPNNKTKTQKLHMIPYFTGDSPVQLYNVIDDPLEKNEISAQYPEVVAKLQARLAEYRKQMVPADFPPVSPLSNPKYYGDVWSPGFC
ncbi:hypothetical protein SNE40_015033 [Patella caerulea]|uniref:Sulfatase N-terminal domain-containing protein n=1 Tax=Patella caerulea TaxID=87958 RepID=A0AAN8PRD8_PATCE